MIERRDDSGDDMPAEIDFSGGRRGKFYRANSRLSLPLYLDAELQARLTTAAAKRGISMADLAAELLKKEIARLEREGRD